MPNTPPSVAQGGPPDDTDKEWLEHARSEQKKALEYLENTAKYLAVLIGVSLTIFLNKQPEQLAPFIRLNHSIAAVLWVSAAVFSFFVLFPWRYKYNPDSPSDIKRTFEKIARVKRVLLLISIVLYLAALILGCWVYLAART